MRARSWDTAKARALKNEGKSTSEIAEAVGATEAAIQAYFSRVSADERRLQQKLAESITVCASEHRQQDMVGPQPLTLRNAVELLSELDKLYPSAQLECGAAEGRFYGLELSLHLRDGQDAPDATVWLK